MEIGKIARKMAELAADSILAEAFSTRHIALAEGHSELAGDVRLLHKLVLTVGESALVAEFAVLTIEPELANLGLLLDLVCGLVSLHIVSGVVRLLHINRWHPEGSWGAGWLEGNCSGLEFSEGGLHDGFWGEEALALLRRQQPFTWKFVFE